MPPSSAALTRLGLSAFITPMLTNGTWIPVRPSVRRVGPVALAAGAGVVGSGAAATGAGALLSAVTVAQPTATAEAANPVAPSFKKSRRSRVALLI